MVTPVSVSAVHPTGFTIALQVASLQDLDATCADLLARGYRPTAGAGYLRTLSGEPLCPRHGVVMRLREKQGDS
jgi:hypothetical protein